MKVLAISKNQFLSNDNFTPVSSMQGNFDEYSIIFGFRALGCDVYQVDYRDWNGKNFAKMFCQKFIDPLPLGDMDIVLFFSLDITGKAIGRFFEMLAAIEKTNAYVINPIETIRHNCDKQYLLELQGMGINIIPTYLDECAVLHEYINRHQSFIAKPRISQHGNGLVKLSCKEDFKKLDRATNYVFQPEKDEFNQGEYSLIFLSTNFQYGWCRCRTPQSDLCNNIHSGAISKAYSPTLEEITFCKSVIKGYKKMGYCVQNARIDFIKTSDGPLLNEAELINPLLLTRYDMRKDPYGLRFAKYFVSEVINDKR